jgi:DNA-binding NarL/FixJ family response regulator
MIKIYVIDDHQTLVVSGLKRLFFPQRDGIEIVGSSNNVETAIIKAKPETFDMFILDLWLENSSPVDNIKKLLIHFPEKKIIIFTCEMAAKWKRRMFNEGAIAYVTKNVSRQELKSVIVKASKGQKYFSINIDEIVDEKTMHNPQIKNYHLSLVEREILKHLSQGGTQRDVAKKMGISLSTESKVLKRLRDHADVKTNLELYRFLLETGEI